MAGSCSTVLCTLVGLVHCTLCSHTVMQFMQVSGQFHNCQQGQFNKWQRGQFLKQLSQLQTYRRNLHQAGDLAPLSSYVQGQNKHLVKSKHSTCT